MIGLFYYEDFNHVGLIGLFQPAIDFYAACAKKDQKVPQGYYNLEQMLRIVSRHKGEIGVCGTCMDARGISEGELAEGTRRSTLEELTGWTQWAEKVLVF